MSEEMVVCQNIGPKQRLLRYRLASLGLVFWFLAVGVAYRVDGPWWWRAALLLPLWGAFVAYFEAHDSTCIVLALRDEQNMDARSGGVRGDPIQDRELARRLRRKSLMVVLKALVCALALTALALGL